MKIDKQSYYLCTVKEEGAPATQNFLTGYDWADKQPAPGEDHTFEVFAQAEITDPDLVSRLVEVGLLPEPKRALLVGRAKQLAAGVAARGEVDATRLAEEVAHSFKCDHWLDDELHQVWEVALSIADACCMYCGAPKEYEGPDCPHCHNDQAFRVSDGTTV